MNAQSGFRHQRLTCPNCGATLVEIERAEVMIDACPQCRGVWLDRGELDRLLERERRAIVGTDEADRDFIEEMSGRRSPAAPGREATRDRDLDSGDRYPDERYRDDDRYRRRRKRKSAFDVLEDLFDFD